MDTQPPLLAAEVLNILRAHQQVLRQAGITRLSLFGSVARNEAGPDSDIDLAAEFDPAAKMDLIRLVELEYELADLLGRRVEILPEPICKERLRANVERDRIRAF
jgi:predicted nucleotidyltransferase